MIRRAVQYRFSLIGLALLPVILTGCNDEGNPVKELPFVRLLEDQQLHSVILNRTIEYAVLLPQDYNESKESYPVVYLLHGYGDDETAWYTYGGIQYYVDGYVSGTVPMIYVMPQANNTYYIDKYNGNYPYMQMFVKELVPTIDEKFRTKRDKTQRAVMGYSMGGYGALILPAMNPYVFSVSVPLSMSFRTDEQYLAETQGSFDVQWAPNFGPHAGASGTERLTDYFKSRSPFHFFDQDNLTAFDDLKILVDCGDNEESLSQMNDALHTLMRTRNVQHEYRVRNGGHSFDYWKKSYPEALQFISHAVQGIEHPSEPVPVSIGTLIQESDYETFDVSGVAINILKPVDYQTTDNNYPVLYLIHDSQTDHRNENVIKVFSMLRNAMTAGKFPKSIVVEVPESDTNTDLLQQVVQWIDSDFRTIEQKGSRVLMGNGLSGTKAVSAVFERADVFGSCFLLSAQLPEEMDINPDVFYYLDATDESSSYKGYHNLYMKIRNEGIEYEYRVRQGAESYQSFLNGLGESISYLKENLN